MRSSTVATFLFSALPLLSAARPFQALQPKAVPKYSVVNVDGSSSSTTPAPIIQTVVETVTAVPENTNPPKTAEKTIIVIQPEPTPITIIKTTTVVPEAAQTTLEPSSSAKSSSSSTSSILSSPSSLSSPTTLSKPTISPTPFTTPGEPQVESTTSSSSSTSTTCRETSSISASPTFAPTPVSSEALSSTQFPPPSPTSTLVGAGAFSVSHAPEPTSTIHYDDGMWHTYYPPKSFATFYAGVSATYPTISSELPSSTIVSSSEETSTPSPTTPALVTPTVGYTNGTVWKRHWTPKRQ